MAEGYGDRPPSRSALLEIRRDRQAIEEGYTFLDEKRVLLAREILTRLEDYAERVERMRRLQAAASEALAAAVARHGLEGVQVYPPRGGAGERLDTEHVGFLGVTLLGEVQWAAARNRASAEPEHMSAEAETCAQRFAEVLAAAAELAAAAINLRRLTEDYRRTERRVHALEEVILPEMHGVERGMEGRLEEVDQEEAVRVRLFARPSK